MTSTFSPQKCYRVGTMDLDIDMGQDPFSYGHLHGTGYTFMFGRWVIHVYSML